MMNWKEDVLPTFFILFQHGRRKTEVIAFSLSTTLKRNRNEINRHVLFITGSLDLFDVDGKIPRIGSLGVWSVQFFTSFCTSTLSSTYI